MSECPMNEHRMLLSCKLQYMILSTHGHTRCQSQLKIHTSYLNQQIPPLILTVIVSLGCRKDAFIVMSELYQVNAISLAIISVDFFTALQIVQTHREVLAAGHQILAVMADVHRVNLLFLQTRQNSLELQFLWETHTALGTYEIFKDEGGLQGFYHVISEVDSILIIVLLSMLLQLLL